MNYLCPPTFPGNIERHYLEKKILTVFTLWWSNKINLGYLARLEQLFQVLTSYIVSDRKFDSTGSNSL